MQWEESLKMLICCWSVYCYIGINTREVASSNQDKVIPHEVEQSLSIQQTQANAINATSADVHKIISNLGCFNLAYPEFLISGINALLQCSNLSQIDKDVW